ncbi:Asp-tRNA(Asn)/Glu-tRNA(Gln) amidotransferase subunit GatC [Thermospira aquatica]|uniref:Aspartyl/glutamyl-tRNA(Asn/Gln) amidotransferase subunit C n=1 Tax=Thermospira aquatica TaxID=2828656 RepID=A0AAX3BGH0_9SPIR|nr:Asp-tRNA(Asn)/Glu-tRNA(Gln) amidotransferase subunit GatC [Thermospira aquatica]URA11198.1 Asp-tRNA(Asn)/Glu-tRNA(Gln) amidotransferase subunit GatC [Thermospira aquatica]
MADITLSDVEKVARLAKLSFSDQEKEVFLQQFSKIVHFVEKIGELDTEHIPPMTHAVEKWNVVREDKEGSSLSNEEIAGIAPRFDDGHIIVPKVKTHE